jgi:hypothetical protein
MVSKRRTGREDGGGRTLESGALAALALTKEKDFDGLLLPPLVALSLEHLIDVIADFLCLLFSPESPEVPPPYKEPEDDTVFAEVLSVLDLPLGSTPLKDVDENLFEMTERFQVVNWCA